MEEEQQPVNGNDDPPEQQQPLQVFLLRDYTRGTEPRFESKFPASLEGRIDRAQFKTTVDKINAAFADAEKLTLQLYVVNCISCLTGYLLNLCLRNPYEKYFERVTKITEEEDAKVFRPAGLKLVNPIDRGLRVLEIRERGADDD